MVQTEAPLTEGLDSLLGASSGFSGPVSEPTAKAILRARGIPTAEGRLCSSPDEAVATAGQVGYPVVLKVVSPQVIHKSDAGGVRVGLGTAEAVRAAYEGIIESVRKHQPQAEIQGLLVERMAAGQELLIGASRTEFGPLMLFGLGGIAVELLRDVSYRLAPLDQAEALAMIREIRTAPLLQGFRGQPEVDIKALADVLVRVSDLLVEYPRIRELDLNPLLARGHDLVVADARILLDEGPKAEPATARLDSQTVEALFAPRSVAVVGATTGRHNRGKTWLARVEKSGYQGKLYAVSRREQVEHWPTFPRVSDLPERPDLAMIEVGRDVVPSVIQECIECGVPWVSVHTAGFAETGTEEGAERLRALQAMLEGTKTYMIGPGALGPYAPASGIIPSELMEKPGPLALLSQSGVTFLALGKMAEEKELGISKAVSYGAEGGVTVDAYMDYLAGDPDTRLVAMYLEGVRRPRAFVAALERLGRAKPVVILKGGLTEAGAKAAASHSGALAGSSEVWAAVCTKGRAVLAETLEEFLDVIIAFTHVEGQFDRRLGIITPSGAAAVTYADACFRNGFQLPELNAAAQERIRVALPPGTSPRNPVDVAQGYFRKEIMPDVFAGVAADENVSFVAFHLAMDVYATTVQYAPWAGETFLQTLVDAKGCGKPLVVVLPYTVADEKRAEVERFLLSKGLAVFPSMDRALKALSKVLWYRGAARS